MANFSSKHYFFCGVGGSGMQSLARAVKHLGAEVSGSDRGFDQGRNLQQAERLEVEGIALVPQDGLGLKPGMVLVVSSAVEPSVPDVKRALELNLNIVKRAELLAELFNELEGLAIAGTSGKSTVTAMVMHVVQHISGQVLGINGAELVNYNSSFLAGDGKPIVIEADESDGSLVLYKPLVGLINNISEDHKPLPELRDIFKTFTSACETLVINADDDEAAALITEQTVTFGQATACDFSLKVVGTDFEVSQFTVNEVPFEITQPGLHNVYNAVAATAVCASYGFTLEAIAEALRSFQGIRRRLERIGVSSDNILVIDDFGHNPDKISASLAALHQSGRPLTVVFQPHGFGPTRLMKEGLITAFITGLNNEDRLIMPEIFYAGGTVARDISSSDLIEKIQEAGKNALFVPDRADILRRLIKNAQSGEIIVIMGARDPSLSAFATQILQQLDA